MKPAPPFEATDALVDLLKPGHAVETQRLAAYGLVRIVPMQKPARLRRKGPVFWAMLGLLVLAADFALALLAWLTVDLVMN